MLSWKEIVQDYIIKHSDRIKRATCSLRDHFGISYFTYHRIDKEGKYTVLVDRPDWAEHYVEEKYFLDDPFLREMGVYNSGFCFLEDHGSEERYKRVLKAGSEKFHLDTSVLLIEKRADAVEFFGYCGNRSSCLLDKLYLNHPELLRSFGSYFKAQLNDVLREMEGEAGFLKELKGEDFFCPELIQPSIKQELQCAYLKGIGKEQDVLRAGLLSQREKECLKMLIQGKSAKETAAALNLSSRTVESYLENAKNKLSCFSKQDLFDAAKRFHELGLLAH
ncbi:MAG: autoinducer binding domain-containing protein [Verrucomicrobia bacterium]|nr:autoinducer binding domain-containing protein [Verrucomicrobiota bacterium]